MRGGGGGGGFNCMIQKPVEDGAQREWEDPYIYINGSFWISLFNSLDMIQK